MNSHTETAHAVNRANVTAEALPRRAAKAKATAASRSKPKAPVAAEDSAHFPTLLARSQAAHALHTEAMRADDDATGTPEEDAADMACEIACTASCVADCAVFDAPATSVADVLVKLRLHTAFGQFEPEHAARPSWNGQQLDENAILAKIIADLDRLASPPPSDRQLIEAAEAYEAARKEMETHDEPLCFSDGPEAAALLRREDDALNLQLYTPAQSLAGLAAKARMVRYFHDATPDAPHRLDDPIADLGERMVGALTRDLIALAGQAPPVVHPWAAYGEPAGLSAKWDEARRLDVAAEMDDEEDDTAFNRMVGLDYEILATLPATAGDCAAKLRACLKSMEDGETGHEQLALSQVLDWLERSGSPNRTPPRADGAEDGGLEWMLIERQRLADKPIDDQSDDQIAADVKVMSQLEETIMEAPIRSASDAATKLRTLAIQIREDRALDAEEGDTLDEIATFVLMPAGLRGLELDGATPLKALSDQASRARRQEEASQKMESKLGQGAREHGQALGALTDALELQASFTPARSMADLIRHAGLIARRANEFSDVKDTQVVEGGATILRHAYAIANGLSSLTELDALTVGGFADNLEPCFDHAFRSPVERAALLWIRSASVHGPVSLGSDGEIHFHVDGDQRLADHRPEVIAEIKRQLAHDAAKIGGGQ